ncbi:uncharacterized protein BYT42DRAFT_611451 [Radiomyces spectabilis]|uniref:uncharacterized protein n=1 Tax=Radiomyces spectabilis TaxID=64574 RepID=UPI0022210DCA|nr:uncharacterized protein BYT42DRAFT_611451 [Radiomyces spectabilis]KAI8388399.1 hypothetical protein BYT42DRAFT_611451 [Radiomyces spectabilis]
MSILYNLFLMANASSKKIAAANKRTLANLQKGFLIVNAIYILWRAIYHWSSFTISQLVLYVCTGGLSMFFYSVLESSGRPSYDASGSLRSSGDDLNAEGLTAYMFDIIYVTWFVHLTTAFISNKFWFAYLVIPAYALYKCVPMIMSYLGSGGMGSEGAAPEAAKSKRQAKLEKRANKGQSVKYVK